MARYVVDMAKGAHRIADHHGYELQDDEAAHVFAVSLIRKLLSAPDMRFLDRSLCVAEITDAEHRLLFHIPFGHPDI
jgi:hypothetical protein